jgi:D-alanyl-D-alanine-carboxypeptidase/D-alanyl-D-alanine-endopeptidase
VPAVVIGALRDGEISVRGFGERAGPGSPAPDGDTILRIGSVTKAFTGEVLAHLTAEGTVQLTQPLAKWAPDLASGTSSDAQPIRLIDLATHSAGLPREVPHEAGPDNDPFAPITRDAFAAWLKKEPLLFAPGSSVLYSNFGFDLLAIALSEAAKKPYPEILQEKITGPLGMRDTGFTLTDEQKKRFMQGQAPDETPLPDVPTGSVIVGSGLYSTPNDLLRWMKWHLNRFGQEDAETRVLDHALYVMRDGLKTASGMDERATWTPWVSAGWHDGEGRQPVHPAKGRRAAGHLLLHRVCADAERGGVHRHQQVRLQRRVHHGSVCQ